MAMAKFIAGEKLFPNMMVSIVDVLQGIGAVSGCGVTAVGGTMTVRVAAGVLHDPAARTISQTDLTIAAADPTNPRKDTIIWDTSGGVLAVVTGTPAAITPVGETNPRKMVTPALPNMTADDDVFLAEVYVPALATDSSTFTYTDRRQLLTTIFDHGLLTGLTDDDHTQYQLESEKGAASGYASLNASTKVVENPANATATPAASKIPIADGSGKLDGWITGISSKAGTATRTAGATGAQAITGVGFQPRAVIILAKQSSSGSCPSIGFGDVSHAEYALGMAVGGTWSLTAGNIVFTGGGTEYCTLASLGADGFTLNWIAVTTNVEFAYLCLK